MKCRISLASFCFIFFFQAMAFASTVSAVRNSVPVKKVFCPVSNYLVEDNPLSITFSVISKTFKTTDVILSVMIEYEAERKKLEQGLSGTTTVLKRLKPFFLGPLKGFGRAVTPFVSGASSTIKKGKLDSKIALFYKNKFKPIKKRTWKPISYTLRGIQAASLLLCKKAVVKGVTIRERHLKEAAVLFIALSKRYSNQVKSTLHRIQEVQSIVLPLKAPMSSLYSALKPMESTVRTLSKGVRVISKALKPVFVGVNKLEKELARQHCITYSAKVKVKVKKNKLWKWKVKVKEKKYCFKFKNIIGKIKKLSSVIQKPVNILFNKTIKPLINQVTKGLRKGLKLDAIRKYQQKIATFQSKFSVFNSLTSKLGGLASDLALMKTIQGELDSIPLSK